MTTKTDDKSTCARCGRQNPNHPLYMARAVNPETGRSEWTGPAWCSDQCRTAQFWNDVSRTRPCAGCNNQVEKHSSNAWCSDRCRKAHDARKKEAFAIAKAGPAGLAYDVATLERQVWLLDDLLERDLRRGVNPVLRNHVVGLLSEASARRNKATSIEHADHQTAIAQKRHDNFILGGRRRQRRQQEQLADAIAAAERGQK